MRRQLVLVVTVSMAVVIVALLVPVLLLVRRDAEATALSQGRLLTQAAATAPTASTLARLSAAAGPGFVISVFRADGGQLGAAAERSPEVARAARGEFVTVSGADGTALFAPTTVGSAPASVRVLVTAEGLREGVGFRSLLAVLLAGLMIVVGAALAAVLGSRLVRPIDELADVAERVAGGDLGARVTVTGTREVRTVGESINRLVVRIEHMLDQQRKDAADLAHRLRTPMTALRLDLDEVRSSGGTPAGIDRLDADVETLSRSIDAVIRSARWLGPAAPSLPGRPVSTDLAVVVRDRARLWSVLAAGRGRVLEVSLPPGPVPVGATRENLETALDTLVGNVFAHTPDGVALAISARPGHPLQALIVDDAGPGFTDATVVQRGRSGGASTGLGLDITRRIAEGSGGRQVVGRSPMGGARIELWFGSAGPDLRVAIARR